MKKDSSRRNFLAAGLTVPAATLTPRRSPQPQASAAGALAWRTLGRAELKVTTVGFGCMVTTDASVIERAAEMGINYFDTARVYGNGNNERMVASALKGRRQKVILSSKSVARSAAEARAHLDTSLRELQTDYLDIWYMHFRDNPGAVSDELLAVWEDAKKQGKIRHIGVSTHNPSAIADRVLEARIVEVVLSVYNFAIGAAHDAAFGRMHKAGIGLVAMKVIAPANRAFGFQSNGRHLEKPGGALAALKWVLKDQRFAATIPSMTDIEQLEENFRAMSERFETRDEKLLARINEEIRPLYCRMCYRCAGQCPRGAAVPETLRYLSYADFYGQFALGREHFAALPAPQREIRCRDCNECAVRCPNGVHVAERMRRAQELFG